MSVRYLLVFLVIIFAACNSGKRLSKNRTIDLETIEVRASKPIYHPTKKRINDLIHTKLEVSFDWEKCYLNGKATLLLKPYFYPTQTLVLDAKGFEIKKVALLKDSLLTDLFYKYDQQELVITLDRVYDKEERYVVEIDYVARPNELKSEKGKAITGAKGLYFINPDGADKYKPKQIWTQGETESSSCWFPTIDAPNEKTTQEIYITVDQQYKTLSNGELVYSSFNQDGTRTDYWKMDLSHSPYLFMMAIGEFSVVKDNWNEIEVNYYVEPDYTSYARNIFGNTPEMLDFFSTKLGVAYPWPKYSQVVVRDYVSGAMENTSAVIHGAFLQRTARELIDKNYESVIAHELFHHWFGDLVTCESWANLCINESFATYGEYLWDEYKYGDEETGWWRVENLLGYLNEAKSKKEPLVRYYYDKPDDLFDSHSYNKGGLILHMLRKQVGDEAFFAALRLFLEKNAYKPTEVSQLRLAFEEITGEDLQWFFDQWFFTAGHPELEIEYEYENKVHQLKIVVEQKQDLEVSAIYKIYSQVDIYLPDTVYHKKIRIDEKQENYTFVIPEKPLFINFDPEKILLAEVKDNQKTEEHIYQYEHVRSFLNRYEAVTYLYKKEKETENDFWLKVLEDSSSHLRELALQKIDLSDSISVAMVKQKASADLSSDIRATAIEILVESEYKEDCQDIYYAALDDSSWLVVSTGLTAIAQINLDTAYKLSDDWRNERNNEINIALARIYSKKGLPTDVDFFIENIKRHDGNTKYFLINYFVDYLEKLEDSSLVIRGLDVLKNIALNEDKKYIKNTAKRSIVILKQSYTENRQQIKEEIKDNKKSKNDTSELEIRLSYLNVQVNYCNDIINELDAKKKEKLNSPD